MTLEERVARLEQRAVELERIEQRLGRVEDAVLGLRSDMTHLTDTVDGLRTDFAGFRADQGAILLRILASIEALQQRPAVFRWPWERPS